MSQINNLNIPKIIGHRGVKNLAPENTLISILEAIKIGLKWVEVDVKISRDEIPFLLHDSSLNRTTNGFGEANSYNYSEIKKLDAGKFFYKKNTNIYPPTLKEVLNLCNDNSIGLNIELKPNSGFEKQNVQKVLEITKEFEKKVPIFYSSFDIESCISVKQINPKAQCGILIDNCDIENVLRLINKYNFFSCGFHIKCFSTKLVKTLKKNNIFATVYSHENIAHNEALELWKLGIDSIFSDDPKNLLISN